MKTIISTGCITAAAIFCFLSLFPHFAAAENEFRCTRDAAPAVKDQLLGKIQRRYESYSDLSADFEQRSLFVSLNQRAFSKGRVYFKKPGKMDWSYTEPEEQRFVADGKTLWFYQPDLKQVTMGQFQEAFTSEVPVSFLLGIGHLSDNFSLERACFSEAGIVLGLRAKTPDPQLEEFQLLVREDSHVPIGARIIDLGGNETEIVFREVALNNNFDDKRFSFVVPRGVDIIDSRAKKSITSRVVE